MTKDEIHSEFMCGNNYRTKYKTKKKRMNVYKQFCDHVRNGLSRDAFPECSDDVMRLMMTRYSDELPIEMLHKAKREAKQLYEKICWAGAVGSRQVNGKLLMFIGMNKHGYTLKQTIETSDASKNDQLASDIEKKVIARLTKERVPCLEEMLETKEDVTFCD